MFKRLWDFFLLTMGITPKGHDQPARPDKWAEARRLKEQEERARIEREDGQGEGERRSDGATERRRGGSGAG